MACTLVDHIYGINIQCRINYSPTRLQLRVLDLGDTKTTASNGSILVTSIITDPWLVMHDPQPTDENVWDILMHTWNSNANFRYTCKCKMSVIEASSKCVVYILCYTGNIYLTGTCIGQLTRGLLCTSGNVEIACKVSRKSNCTEESFTGNRSCWN